MNSDNGRSLVAWFIFLFLATACSSAGTKASDLSASRCPAEASRSPHIRLLPQELYGDAVLAALDSHGHEGVTILQFSFFTEGTKETYPRQIAQKLINIRKENPHTPIVVALESRKDIDEPKGIAQRNAKTKAWLMANHIEVKDVHGRAINLPKLKYGASHAKLVIVGDTIIAGSTNLSQQSTTIGANNEMNIVIRSAKMAAALRDYVQQVIVNPDQMLALELAEGNVRLLTDQLHFSEIVSQIRKAQKGDQLGLSMYQFLYRSEKDEQAKQIFEELVAAQKRGVQVEIYLNRASKISEQNTASNLRVAELLLQNDVRKVYFDPEDKISHSKFLYRLSGNEKIAVISSVNFYNGDFNDNHQLTWVVKNDVFVDQLVTYFKHQIAYDGVLVSQIPQDARTGLRYTAADDKSLNAGQTIWHTPLAPKPMIRFWRGFKQDNTSRVVFESNVNTYLIPETIKVGAERGLISYLPSFFPDDKPDFLPDEVAIIAYADEEMYNAIRTTKDGRRYGPLHFDEGFFSKKNQHSFSSGSLVAVPYTNKVEIRAEGQAYILGPENINWQRGAAVRRTLLPAQGSGLGPAQVASFNSAQIQQYLSQLQSRLADWGLNGVIAVVDPQYVLLMMNFHDELAAQKIEGRLARLEEKTFKKIDHTLFANQKHGSTNLAPGSGINVLFPSPIKPQKEIVSTILNEFKESAEAASACDKPFQTQ